DEFPQSRSVGLIEGRARTSSALRPRRVASAIVSGMGPNLVGSGYLRMLKRQWAGGPKLVRANCFSTLWHLIAAERRFLTDVIAWAHDGATVAWTHDDDPVLWFSGDVALTGVPSTRDGWHGILVSGLPASQLVGMPSQCISVSSSNETQEAYVLTLVTSDANGEAFFRTDRAEAFTVSGLVSVGKQESVVLEALSDPRAVQSLSEPGQFRWEFREVFEDEYTGAFTELDPWR
ncbi:MAG: hypothetical protein AAGD43_02650, partial [Pseudomonadota bacterium]